MIVAVLSVPSTAAAPTESEVVDPGEKKLHHDKCAKRYSRGDFHRQARRAVRRPPLTSRERKTVKHALRCQVSRRSERNVRAHWGRYKSAYRRRQAVARVTPYDCGRPGRFAIPCGIVACESRYSWSAYNANSGARGPYQLLGKPDPWPANTASRRLAHHQIAYRLYAGGAGRSHWVCRG